MKVTVNGQKTTITFEHNKKKRRVICRLQNTDGGLLAEGESQRNKEDKDNRVVGRKLALVNALRGYDRKTRLEIWEGVKKSNFRVVSK